MIGCIVVEQLTPGKHKTTQIGICRQFSSLTILFVFTVLVMGCQHPPSLGDAQIGSIRLATAEDLTRLQQAQDELKRQIFGGAIIHDRKLGEIHFNQNEFDQADRYEREHGLPTISSVGRPRSGPRLLISFYTDVVLVDSGDENTIYTTDANLILCDHPQMMVGRSTLMWNGRFLSSAQDKKVGCIES